MASAQKEAQLLLAIQAIQNTPKLSIRRAAAVYNVSHTTLRARLYSRQSIHNIQPKVQKLTKLEEYTIVQKVLELDSQAFPPRLSAVEDIANRLLRDCNALRVGKNWATNFVRRQLQLKSVFSCKYDYSRALCEDPKLV